MREKHLLERTTLQEQHCQELEQGLVQICLGTKTTLDHEPHSVEYDDNVSVREYQRIDSISKTTTDRKYWSCHQFFTLEFLQCHNISDSSLLSHGSECSYGEPAEQDDQQQGSRKETHIFDEYVLLMDLFEDVKHDKQVKAYFPTDSQQSVFYKINTMKCEFETSTSSDDYMMFFQSKGDFQSKLKTKDPQELSTLLGQFFDLHVEGAKKFSVRNDIDIIQTTGCEIDEKIEIVIDKVWKTIYQSGSEDFLQAQQEILNKFALAGKTHQTHDFEEKPHQTCGFEEKFTKDQESLSLSSTNESSIGKEETGLLFAVKDIEEDSLSKQMEQFLKVLPTVDRNSRALQDEFDSLLKEIDELLDCQPSSIEGSVCGEDHPSMEQ